MARKSLWNEEDLTKIFETLIDANCTITSDPAFRKHLTRNESLFANQITREANGNIAYRSVDVDCLEMSDEDFWDQVDSTQYNDLIEDNAAAAMLKMAEKLDLLN